MDKHISQDTPSKGLLLGIKDLTFGYERGCVLIGEGISFSISRGEILALVGESGCGKSLTGLAILGLLPPGIKIFKGEIDFKGRDLTRLSFEEYRRLRGAEIAIIFQDPMTAFNPVFTVGDQIAEVLTLHQGLDQKEALSEAARLLAEVGIPSPMERLRSYPHELSGGMRQRAMIAMALAGEPELLIADEPTTALDVTIQAQILSLLEEIREKTGLTVLLISHDLAVVAELADRVTVMYAGRLVEEASVKELFSSPLHPYTKVLLDALPRLGQRRISVLPGRVPPPGRWPKGCKFADRCPWAYRACLEKEPALEEKAPGHKVRCYKV